MSKRILIVEDDQDLLNLYRTVLVQVGYTVEVAHNAMIAAHALDNNNYDLIITDLQMPDEPGTAVIKRIQSNERHKNAVIMVMTANEHMLGEVKALGVEEFMVKPFTIVAISKKVKMLLGDA